jgi:hypothetical protein
MRSRRPAVPAPNPIEYRRSLGVLLASLLAYTALTAAVGWRVVASLGSAIASDPGDPLLNAAILVWNATVTPWTEAWYQFPVFHPTPNALLLSEHLLGASPVATPVYWLTGNALAAYNVTLLASYPLCGIAMYALVWRLTRSAPAAFLAGLAFAFAPYRAGQVPHIQVLLVWWMPLALLALHEFVDTAARTAGRVGGAPSAGRMAGPPSAGPALRTQSRLQNQSRRPGATADDRAPRTRRSRWKADPERSPVRWLLLFALCWLFQGASNGYFLVYFSLLVGLWVLWFLAARRRWREARAIALAMAAAALPLAPILYRYVEAHDALGLSRNLGEIAAYGADIAAPLCAPAGLTFWGWLRVACAQEGELFAGAGLLALCAIAAFRRAEPRSAASEHAHSPETSRLRVLAVRVALTIAFVYICIALSVVAAGPWRIDAGSLHASASSVDKPATVAFVLLLAAVLLSRRFHDIVRRGDSATFYLLAALSCWILSWGPFPRLLGATALYQAPFAWLLQLPGVGGLRVPARFWMMTITCLVVFMGIAVARTLQERSRRWQIAFVALASPALAMDGWMPIPAAPVPTLGATPPPAATVAVLPIGDRALDAAVVYHAVTGGWRAVNGFSGYEPVYYEALRTLSDDRDPRALEPFVALGDLHVVNRLTGARERRRRGTGTAVPSPSGVRRPLQAMLASCAPDETALAHDHRIDTAWVCGTQMVDHQVTADLGAVVSVGSIVHAIGAAGAFFPRHLIVETSADGEAWSEAWSGSLAYPVLHAALAAPRETRAVLAFPRRDARFVRLRQTGRHPLNYWAIAEFEVWSGPD